MLGLRELLIDIRAVLGRQMAGVMKVDMEKANSSDRKLLKMLEMAALHYTIIDGANLSEDGGRIILILILDKKEGVICLNLTMPECTMCRLLQVPENIH